jgi:hypothetical protein
MLEKLFLSVGAMKAGTTWLNHQLADHPEILFSPEKEIHYFAAPDGETHPMRLEDRVRRFKRVVGNVNPENYNRRVRFNMVWYARRYLAPKVNQAWYEALFSHRQPGQWCADFSNLYCLLDADGWQRVRETAEEVRALYTLRHPLKRMWSHVVFHHEFAGVAVDLSGWSVADFERFFSQGQEGAHGDYAANLARLRANLAEEELKVLFFESIRTEPQAVLNGVEQFLGIAKRTYARGRLERQVNPSKPQPMPRAFIDYAAPIHKAQARELTAMGLKVPAAWELDL